MARPILSLQPLEQCIAACGTGIVEIPACRSRDTLGQPDFRFITDAAHLCDIGAAARCAAYGRLARHQLHRLPDGGGHEFRQSSDEPTSELQSLMRITDDGFCSKKKTHTTAHLI